MYKNGDVIGEFADVAGELRKIRLEGEPHFIHGNKDKYWMKGFFVCDEVLDKRKDGRICNGCANHCEKMPLFVKIYEGDDKDIIQAIENQGQIQIESAYIAKSYGIYKNSGAICVAVEYADGKNIRDFCEKLDAVRNPENNRHLTEREKLVIKYRFMRQMLYVVRDYQRYRKEQGIGIHLDLKPEHFIVVEGERWNDFHIKLIDFEGFANQNQQLSVFQSSAGYAHPEHLECFSGNIQGVQICPYWDYYALGIIFQEILENRSFYTREDLLIRREKPRDLNKNVLIEKHKADMCEDERQELVQIIRKMVSVDKPYDSVNIIIQEMNEFLNRWIQKDEWKIFGSSELLKKEENEFNYVPYIQLGVSVTMEDRKKFTQYYEIPQNGIVSLVYNVNIPSWSEDMDYAGYFYESSGEVYCFNMEDQSVKLLETNSEIRIGDCMLEVILVNRQGCWGNCHTHKKNRFANI